MRGRGTLEAGSGSSLLPRGRPPSILIVMMSALGDTVQVLPVLSALKKAFPECSISWLIQEGPYTLVRGHPAVDEFILFPRGRKGLTPGALVEGAGAVRETSRRVGQSALRHPGGRYDLLLDLQVYFKAGLLTALAPAHIKLGFDGRRTRDLNTLFTTHRIPPHPEGFGHTQDQYLEFLTYLGIAAEPLTYGLSLNSPEREAQGAFFMRQERPVCALVATSSSPAKDWTPEGYARVSEGLYHDLGLQPLLVGGVSRREEEFAGRVRNMASAPVLDARKGDVRRLLWILEGSRLVVSPDTGPLHMARALETPVVGLYGCTNPKRSGPYRMFQELIVDGYALYPGEDYPTSPERRKGGMDRISPAMVLEKVELALARY